MDWTPSEASSLVRVLLSSACVSSRVASTAALSLCRRSKLCFRVVCWLLRVLYSLMSSRCFWPRVEYLESRVAQRSVFFFSAASEADRLYGGDGDGGSSSSRRVESCAGPKTHNLSNSSHKSQWRKCLSVRSSAAQANRHVKLHTTTKGSRHSWFNKSLLMQQASRLWSVCADAVLPYVLATDMPSTAMSLLSCSLAHRVRVALHMHLYTVAAIACCLEDALASLITSPSSAALLTP